MDSKDILYEKIRNYLTKHPIYNPLSEQELDEAALNIFKKHSNDDESLLNEYADMYMMSTAGMGSSNYGFGSTGGDRFGGVGQGVRVYGYDNGNGATPGNGYAAIGNGSPNGDPEVVTVPEKLSTYEPWKTEIDQTGDTTSKTTFKTDGKESFEDMWNGPVGDILRGLEMYGYDIDDIIKMDQEDLEDTLLKFIKREHKESLNENHSMVNKLSEKLIETFLWEDDELLEYKKGRSKIQDARHILATKHQQKKALSKNESGRKYIIDRYTIEKLMHDYGYYYDGDVHKWLKKSKKVKTKKPDAPAPTNNEPKADPQDSSSGEGDAGGDAEEDSNTKDNSSAPVDASSPKDINLNPLSNQEIVNKLKLMQARLLLAIAHDLKDSVVFVKPEPTKEVQDPPMVPTVGDDKITAEMENRDYAWDEDKKVWLNVILTLPDQLFEMGETKKSLIGRSYLSAISDNNIKFIQFKPESPNELLFTPVDVDAAMETNSFKWDGDTDAWTFIPPETKQLNEAIDSTEKEYGYAPVKVEELTGRMVLRAEQLKRLKDMFDRGDPQTSIDAYKDSIKDGNDPVNFGPTYNIEKPLMKANKVDADLKKLGYNHFNLGRVTYWSNKHDVPDVIKNMGESLDTYLARATLAAKTKSGKYAAYAWDMNAKGDNYEFIENSNRVEKLLDDKGYSWSKTKGWIPNEGLKTSGHDDTYHDAPEAQRVEDEQERDFISSHYDSDWDLMTSKDKKEFKKAKANEMSRRLFGIKSKAWLEMDETQKRKSRNKMQLYYKFDNDQKTFVKRDKPVPMSAINYIGVKSSLGYLGRILGTTLKGTVSILGNALLNTKNLVASNDGNATNNDLSNAKKQVSNVWNAIKNK